MIHTGIWLDKERALILTLNNEKETLTTINSEIENYHPTSNKTAGGPLEISKDRKYLEREKQQFKAYFKELVSVIMDTDALVIFGPAETKDKFSKELSENHNKLSTKIKGVKKADSMTENQMKAWVKDFFKLR
jgi:stalled ribosome rescue protein Dom34